MTRITQPEIYPNKNRVDVSFQLLVDDNDSGAVKILPESYRIRHFSRPELELFAGADECDFVGTEEFLMRNIQTEKSWGVICIFKKF